MPVSPRRTYDQQLIPFYGSRFPRLFEIERRCMDREGKVLGYLHQRLPSGTILDIGAGNGFTALKLSTAERRVVALEPDPGMVDPGKPLNWVRGVAQAAPFQSGAFDAAYATWAFFFDGIPDIEDGIREVERVVKPGGIIYIIDNAGNDAFCALSPHPIASDPVVWQSRGFSTTILETAYRFDSLEEASELLAFYFGQDVAQKNRETVIGYNVAVYSKQV